MQVNAGPTGGSARRRLALAALVVLVCAIAGLAYLTRPWASEDAGTGANATGMLDGGESRPGGLAPNFALTDQDGRRVELADFKGQAVFLNFWADWCSFCKEEMPDMQRIADEFGGQLVVLGLNTGDSVEIGERFVQRAGVRYQRLYDLELEVTEGYAVQAMPTSYFIDASGRIIDFSFGFMTYQQMLAKVERLLDGS